MADEPEVDQEIENQPEVESPESETTELETDEVVDDEAPGPEEADGVVDEPPVDNRKPSRANDRIRNLIASNKEQKEKAEKLEREMAELKQQVQQPRVNPDEARRLREEKLSLMDPSERKQFVLEEQVQELRQQNYQTQLHVIDATDKAAYDAKASLNPIYAKHKDQVEKALASLRSKGNNASREELLKWVIGNEALKKAGKPNPASRQAAARRVESAKAKPAASRSDAPSHYSGKGSTPEERLRGVLI